MSHMILWYHHSRIDNWLNGEGKWYLKLIEFDSFLLILPIFADFLTLTNFLTKIFWKLFNDWKNTHVKHNYLPHICILYITKRVAAG